MSPIRVALLLALTACNRQGPTSPSGRPPEVKPGLTVAAPDGGVRHTERLAWIGWSGELLRACSTRAPDLPDDQNLHHCRVVSPRGPVEGGAAPAFARDGRPVDFAPGGCRVHFDDIAGAYLGPARALLLTPTARVPLDAWQPAPTDLGDYFAVETSFSPDGKWLGLVHVSVGLGVDERPVDVLAAEVRSAPTCK